MHPTPPPALFSLVPQGLFGPLASGNRQHYWQLLCRLFDEFFGPDAPLPPSVGLPRREITAAIERYLLTDDPWEQEDGDSPDAPLGVRANAIYERFRSAGWLRQERVGVREMVSMPPIVSQLLSTLLAFCEAGPMFVSARMRSIELLVQSVASGNASGDALDEAADQARRLLASLAAMSLQVRDLMPELGKAESTAQFARQLFERYVGQLFIGDYAELHLRDHPLARSSQILATVRSLREDGHAARLRGWYREHVAAGDEARAEARLQRSLRRLEELDRIDDYLGRLDEDIRHANRRALAFLDYRLRAPAQLDVLLRRAVRGALAAPADALRAPVGPAPLMDRERLRPPRRAPVPIPRGAVVATPPSPEQLARLALLRRMKRARLVTPEDLARYLAAQRGDADTLASDALRLASIEDLRAYQTLLTLALRSHRRGGLRRDDPMRRLQAGFRVELLRDDAASADDALLRSTPFRLHFTRPPA